MSAQKAQTFASKLRILQDFCSKLSNLSSNLPSSSDIIGILKYFQNTLHSSSKDISELRIERFHSRVKDNEWRTQTLPAIEYGELYLCLLSLSENVQKLTNQSALCEHLLRTLHHLVIFLDYDCLEGLPLALAWMLLYFPVNVQPSVMELMCSVVIPLIYTSKEEQESYAIDSIPAILTLVFQHVEKIEYHVWVLESFLSKKKELHKDLLILIAYGPTEARLPAVCLLFHYWPELYPAAFYQNQTLQPLHYAWEPWKSITCDRTDCPNKAGKAIAMKMTVNPRICAQHGGKPPPLYVCLDCADALNRRDFDQLSDILLPSKKISLTCESKTCRSKSNQASITCWSMGCTFLTGNRAIRFCDACHTLRHSYGQATGSRPGAVDGNEAGARKLVPASQHPGQHIYQISFTDVWDMPLDLQYNMVEAIVALSRETMPRWRLMLSGSGDVSEDNTNRMLHGLSGTSPNPPGAPSPGGDVMMLTLNRATSGLGLIGDTNVNAGTVTASTLGLPHVATHMEFLPTAQNTTPVRTTAIGNANTVTGEFSLSGRYSDEDHKVLAVYGALLVGEKCKPRERLNVEQLTRITACVFNWFLDTIYTTDNELGDLLEKVKSEYMTKWIQEVQRLHPEAILAVLLPHPLEYARVGSCWDALCDRTTQVKHGLSRIGSLIPYDLVTFETWDFVMPYWVESIRTEVPRADYFELEVLLKKIFDATAGPFPFLPQKVYHFVSGRFAGTPVAVQDQALAWLEILTSVEVPIPMKELLTMFRRGVESFHGELLLPTSLDDSEAIVVTDSTHRSQSHDPTSRTSLNLTGPSGQLLTNSDSISQVTDGNLSDSVSVLNDEHYAEETDSLLATTSSNREPRKNFLQKLSIRDRKRSSYNRKCVSTSPSTDRNQRPQSQPAKTASGTESTRTTHHQYTEPEYRMTDCLAQMLNIAYRQLKIHDPLGHAGYNQETPQVMIALLGDMLQLYWGSHGEEHSTGLRDLHCRGLETCLFPRTRVKIPSLLTQCDLPESRSECMNCLDMLTWLNYANLICQHLAPIRPSPKNTVYLSGDSLLKATELPAHTDWRVPGCNEQYSPSHGSTQYPDDQSGLTQLNMEELNRFPLVLRFIYLLIQLVNEHDSTPFSPNQDTETEKSAPKTQQPKDPIVLQCVLESLVYLCHVGDCLQSVLNQNSQQLSVSTGDGSTTMTNNAHGQRQFSGGRPSTFTASAKTVGVGGGKQCTASSDENVHFVHYLNHSHLLPSLWNLLKAELSPVASWTVPLLFHCICLPGGLNVFWDLVEADFSHPDWRYRFGAVEKVSVLMRELDTHVLTRGFSGTAGTKIINILSGGSVASASGVGLFGRSATAGGNLRSRIGGGRMAVGKGGSNISRSHGTAGGVAESKSAANVATNENPLIQTALAHAFCCLIGSLDDSNSMVAQFTSSQLTSLNRTALSCGIQCLEFQFDTVIADRCLILRRMHQLSCALPRQPVFSWSFFVNRFGVLALQAQMHLQNSQDLDTIIDLNGYNRNSQHFQNQFERACFASSRSVGLKSISLCSRAQSLRSPTFMVQSMVQTSTIQTTHLDSPPTESVTTSFSRMSGDPISSTGVESISHSQRFQSSRRARMSMSSFSGLFPGSLLGGEFMDSSNKFLSNIRNALDVDSNERDTLHQWVRLLLKFMATVRFDTASDDVSSAGGRHHVNTNAKDELRDRKALSKAQRHLAFLLGYTDGSFNIPPYKMRNSTVFQSFIAHVGGVLDRNFDMGCSILYQTLVVLQFCASPQRYATDNQPPTFTLRLLEPQVRIHWLQTLLVILYKYEYQDGGSGLTGTSNLGTTVGATSSSANLGSVGMNGASSGMRLRKTSSEARMQDPDESHRLGSMNAIVGGMVGQLGSHTNETATGASTNAALVGQHYLCGLTGPSNANLNGTRGLVEYLIQIVLNTINAQVHVCRTHNDDESFDPSSPPIRLREVSTVSADINTIMETDTPPASPHKEGAQSEDDVVMPGVTVTLVDQETSVKCGAMDEFLPQSNLTHSEFSEAEPDRDSCAESRKPPHRSLLPATMDPIPAIPSTVSTSDQAIHAWHGTNSPQPILAESIEMSVLVDGKAVVTNEATGSSSIDMHSVHKMGKKVGLRFHKRNTTDFGDIKDATSKPKLHERQKSSAHSLDRNTEASTIMSKTSKLKYIKAEQSTNNQESLFRSRDLHESELKTDENGVMQDTPTYGIGDKTVKSNAMKKPPAAAPPPPPQKSLSRSGSASNLAVFAATTLLTTERCPWCNQILEQYDEQTLGYGLLCLATFVHREPSLAAPYLRDMLLIAARLANSAMCSWQTTLSHIIVPGNVASIARQFLRCTMYNLAPNGLFVQLFQTPIPDEHFFRSIITVLVDFEDHLSFFQPILSMLEVLNKRKALPNETLPILLENVADYLEHLPNLTDDMKLHHFIVSGWTDIVGPLEIMLRRLVTTTPVPNNLATTVRIMTYILRSPVATNFKTLPDTFAAILRRIVENVHFKLSSVIELCSLSNRTLKDRNKIQLSKAMVELFVQAIKFRISIPDENLMKLLQFILMDAGGTVEPNQVVEGLTTLFNPQTYHLVSTNAAELMRPHLADCVTYLSDVHTIHKVKQSQKTANQLHLRGYDLRNEGIKVNTTHNGTAHMHGSLSGGLLNATSAMNSSAPHGSNTMGGISGGFVAGVPSLHEDVLGAHLKSGLAQYVSLELSRSSSSSDQDVLPLLAPGLLTDVRPFKSTGFVSSNPVNQRSKQTGGPSSSLNTGSSTSQSYHIASDNHSTKFNRSSGSIISKQSEDTSVTDRNSRRSGDTTLIVITPSPDNPSDDMGKLETGQRRTLTAANIQSSSMISRTPSPVASNYSGIEQSSLSSIQSPNAGLFPPGAPGSGGLTRLGIYGHVTLSPTVSQTSQLDAPVLHLLPWLKSIPPSSQLGPRDFLVMVERVRTLTWLLLGAIMNMALTREATGLTCRPIPLVLVRSVTDLVKALLSSFPDQQKQSVTVMSSLYHVFTLCQIWTVYCETAASMAPIHSVQHKAAMATAVDFWIRIMPTILRLLSISEDFIIVSGRLLTVMEELIECQCSTVIKIIPLWIPMLCGRHRQIPGNMLKRLQKCIEYEPPEPHNRMLLLLSIPDSTTIETNKQVSDFGQHKGGNGDHAGLQHTMGKQPIPGLSTSSLLACQANTLMGCNPLMRTVRGPPEENIPITGGTQCLGHALAPSAPYMNGGMGIGVGIGAGSLGTDLLSSRLVTWLKKHIFVLGRNEDQHSTATHIFVH